MEETRKGPACVFGDNINTDIISPPQYMELSVEEASAWTMSGVDPDFAKRARERPGTIVVAGNNFGSGSSRELAPLSLKALNVGAIVAKFFARIFYRNAINLGIPVVECAEVDDISRNDELEIHFTRGKIVNLTKNRTYTCSVLPAHILELVLEGGLIAYFRKCRDGGAGQARD